MLVSAFKSYTLPIVEYCSYVWNPYKLSDIDNLESVQRHFTKRLKGLKHKSYAERLIICSLSSLELRRLVADIVMCYKIINKLVCLKFDDFFEFDTNSVTRGHNLKLKLPHFKTDCRKNFFSIRIAPVWNSLPSNLVNCSSLVLFKKRVKLHDLSQFLTRKYDAVHNW